MVIDDLSKQFCRQYKKLDKLERLEFVSIFLKKTGLHSVIDALVEANLVFDDLEADAALALCDDYIRTK